MTIFLEQTSEHVQRAHAYCKQAADTYFERVAGDQLNRIG
jgi:hypothetical protein